MSENLYLVTCDGHAGGYGSEIYLVGIFTTKEQAEAAINQVNLDINTVLRNKDDDFDDHDYCHITLANKDTVYLMRPGSSYWWDEFSNDKYLGGYCE
mgnify:CR=1 FL=1